jgi:zeta-carotene desaturase
VTGAAVKLKVAHDGRITAHSGADTWTALAIVAAVPWFALSDLFEQPPAVLADTLSRARATASSPVVTVNLWFDREVMDEPFIGLPGRVMQWVFDKRAVFGDDDHAASHLSLVSSGAEPVLRLENPDLIAMAHNELLEALPLVRRARLTRATVIRELRATFSLAPGQPARPRTVTALRGFYLAGDWIETGLPATIESAVRSGHAAADAICIR